MITKKANLPHVLNNLLFKKNEPVSLVHFVTNRCNARCSFCFIDFDNPDTFKAELTLEEIDNFTKNLGKSLLNVNLTGGEPFARKDLIDIANLYIKNTTIQSLYITTNASLPDRVEKFVDEVQKMDNELELTFQISIDDKPAEHDRVRKIKGLFDKCMDTYKLLQNKQDNVSPMVSITVTHENCDRIEDIFNYLYYDCSIRSLKCTIVRDEGVYKTPLEKRKKILDAYNFLTNKIQKYCEEGKMIGYNEKSLQGRLHKRKDFISWKLVKEMYLKPKYISPCHSGSLFGIITAKGDVYPCEILEDKLLGNLRNNNYDFIKIWKNDKTQDVKKFIKKTKCNCTYECALTYNILGNYRYYPKLVSEMFNL